MALKWWQTTILWTMRVFLLVPFAFMFTEFWNAALGHPGALDNISTSGNDVLGTSALMFFMLMLAVTPVRTVTGWRWHQPLRREFGLAMWVIATTDLFLAILSTANRIPGGLITRFAGHGFLFFGTISTVMLLPLAITANQRAQRWLGRHWKTLHKLVYVIWVTILIHLFLLFGFNSIAVEALVISLPLVYFRIPFIRDWWNTARRTHTDLLTRVVCGAILGFLFMLPMVQFMRELLNTGVGAFVGHPPG